MIAAVRDDLYQNEEGQTGDDADLDKSNQQAEQPVVPFPGRRTEQPIKNSIPAFLDLD